MGVRLGVVLPGAVALVADLPVLEAVALGLVAVLDVGRRVLGGIRSVVGGDQSHGARLLGLDGEGIDVERPGVAAHQVLARLPIVLVGGGSPAKAHDARVHLHEGIRRLCVGKRIVPEWGVDPELAVIDDPNGRGCIHRDGHLGPTGGGQNQGEEGIRGNAGGAGGNHEVFWGVGTGQRSFDLAEFWRF